MFSFIIKKIFGSRNERYLKQKDVIVKEINELERKMKAFSDDMFPLQIKLYKEQIKAGEVTLDSLLPEVFALVREASFRVLGMRHFDVQLLGGIVLHSGKIAEMRTGEGKTLMATLPVVLNALTGKGVHVVTVNDYLAKRDATWMGKLYNFLGLSVGIIIHGLSDEERQAAYGCDITYGTNNEFGFDYLRDNMKFYKHQIVQREHNFAIVDEVDSILIDEARTPLIISGPSDDATELYTKIDAIISHLKIERDFTLDEKTKSILLTDEGVQRCEKLLDIDNLFDMQNIAVQHHVNQALKAHYAFNKNVDYVVDKGKVVIIDEFTGRKMDGRRFSDGLHQALEAKEGVKIEAENQTLASITFQNYFRLYEKLGGMTGTADTEAVEFHEIYGLDVINIPTHKPMIRQDLPDIIYRSKREKNEAIIAHIKELYAKQQPVLVGTISIEGSEVISECLKKNNIPHNVLNANHEEQEASIIAEAGQKGKVTIATNIAGRGTDIALGEGVKELGGLFILGTERHESRRIDNQLRGRSGRQGEPGTSRFYISLEDELMLWFGSDRVSKILEHLGFKEGESIEHKMLSKAIENAQKRVEGRNFEIRKTLLDYDNVMNQQREVIYSLRKEAIMQEDVTETLKEFACDLIDDIYAGYEAMKGDAEADNELKAILNELFNYKKFWNKSDLPNREEAKTFCISIMESIQSAAGWAAGDIFRYYLLEELDKSWKEHLLNMDYLREGIGLRGYGQRDPKQEYKQEGFLLFKEMIQRIKENVFKTLSRIQIKQEENLDEDSQKTAYIGVSKEEYKENLKPEQPEQPEQKGLSLESMNLKHKENSSALSYSSGTSKEKAKTPEKRSTPKIGRNDECPCGSGKKYKKCCGRGE